MNVIGPYPLLLRITSYNVCYTKLLRLKTIERELKLLDEIIHWHKTLENLQNEKTQLLKDQEELEKVIIEKQSVFKALELYKEAEPFKDVVDHLNRTEKELEKKQLDFKLVCSSLLELQSQCEQVNIQLNLV